MVRVRKLEGAHDPWGSPSATGQNHASKRLVMSQSIKYWDGYVLDDHNLAAFEANSIVLDVGCGTGEQLDQLVRRGCFAVGLDIDTVALASCSKKCTRLLQARAEELPVRTSSLDGLVCNVVIPYTDERWTIREIARVLRPGALGHLCSHGAGYYLHYLCFAPTWRLRFYGARTLLNTWLYAVTGRSLPGFLGDTVFQSERRLRAYYRQNGLCLRQKNRSRTFAGFPVFIYHAVQKAAR